MSTVKKKKMSAGQLTVVSRLFAVLSEPSRLVLLQTLHDGPMTVSELMAASGMKQANVSKHLAVLHDHRLVKRDRAGTSVCYQIADPMIFALCNLVCGKVERDAKCVAALFHPEI